MRRTILVFLFCFLTVNSTGFLVAQDSPAPPRGDVNTSGGVDLSDAVRIFNFLFLGGPPAPCDAVADANADGRVNLADGVFLLNFLFTGGDALPDLSAFEARICSTADTATFQKGMEVYMTPAAGGNAFACSTCHSMMPPDDEELRRPGHSLYDALRRPTYKNGALETFLEAANVCRVHWMVSTPWTEEDTSFLDVVSFMNAIAPRQPAPALIFEIAPSAIVGPSAGDPARGCETFHGTCVVCHGEGAQGTILAPSLVFNPDAGLDPDYIRRRVRTSGSPDSVYGDVLTGGVMPFWSSDRLSAGELEDIVAWLTTRPVPDCVEDPVAVGEVVRRGTFTTRFHGVSGLIEELDSRQIRLREFSYDGQGIQVRLWLYRDGSIQDGYAIGPDLLRPFPGWENETLVVDIPENLSPDMYDAVSIWCVPARANFGEGVLETVQ